MMNEDFCPQSVQFFDTTVQKLDTRDLFKSVILLACYGLQKWHDICIFFDRKNGSWRSEICSKIL